MSKGTIKQIKDRLKLSAIKRRLNNQRKKTDGVVELISLKLDGADLRGIDLRRVNFSDIHFKNMDFNDMDFIGSKFIACTFEDCSCIRSNFKDTYIDRSYFLTSNFQKGKFEESLIKRSTFNGSHFNSAVFDKSVFTDTTFNGCNLNFADFGGCKVDDVAFNSCNLYNSYFTDAKIFETSFEDSYLMGSDFARSSLDRCDFTDATFTWIENTGFAKFKDIGLSGTNLQGTNLGNHIIQVSGIGSAGRTTTYCFEDDSIWCGCFYGNLETFEAKVRREHSDNPEYLEQYTTWISYLKNMRKFYLEKGIITPVE